MAVFGGIVICGVTGKVDGMVRLAGIDAFVHVRFGESMANEKNADIGLAHAVFLPRRLATYPSWK